ncbi:MAG: hypothetical protein HY863_12415 [Chloroflexi bacterium]|nr:hypothetical protein [Chloroflexota bacterium]
MKKISIFLICAILLSSCSLTLEQLFLLPVPTGTPLPTSTNIPTDTPTLTPIIPTLTYTVTPTLVGIKTETTTPEFTSTVISPTPTIIITPNTPTPTIEMKGFLTVILSDPIFYKGNGCQPTSVKITAQATDYLSTFYVVLFVRFKVKQSDAKSEWTRIAIPSKDYSGTFTHELIPDEIKSVSHYHNAWVQYQFVAFNSLNIEIGRTGIFGERLTLLDCVPTTTPTLSPTPTILKP